MTGFVLTLVLFGAEAELAPVQVPVPYETQLHKDHVQSPVQKNVVEYRSERVRGRVFRGRIRSIRPLRGICGLFGCN